MPTNPHTLSIVDSLAEVTRHHDRNILEKSMLTTIDELFPGNTLSLFSVDQLDHNASITLLAYMDNGNLQDIANNPPPSEGLLKSINEAIESRAVTSTSSHLGDQSTHSVFPAINNEREVFAAFIFTGRAPLENELHLIHALLKVYSNYMALLDKTQRDKLTGLFNRETLDTELTKSIINYQLGLSSSKNIDHHSPDRPATKSAYVGIIDIDHFKSINDNFGHLYGDEILVLVARFLRENFTRKEDLVYRYGGEEFVVLLGSNTHDNAVQAFERMRKNIENHQFPQIDSVTVSIGFVAINGQESASDAIGQADKALYYAKEHGRNQTISYEELIASGAIQEQTRVDSGDADLF